MLLRAFVRANKRLCRWLIDSGWAREEQDVVAQMREEIEQAMDLQAAKRGPTRLLEVGGTRRPFLPRDDAYEYHGLDIDNAPGTQEQYDEFKVQSVTDPIDEKYQIVFSKYLLEHVPDNASSIKELANCLVGGGEMIHLIPCGYHPYSVLTWIVGNRIQRLLIQKLRPESVGITGYPAFYDCCTPQGMRHQMETNGMEVTSLHVYWGASEYFTFFVPFFLGIKAINWVMRRLRMAPLASAIVIRARKRCDVAEPDAKVVELDAMPQIEEQVA